MFVVTDGRRYCDPPCVQACLIVDVCVKNLCGDRWSWCDIPYVQAYLVVDDCGVILAADEDAVKMFGHSTAELLGADISVVSVHGLTAQRRKQPDECTADTGSDWSADWDEDLQR